MMLIAIGSQFYRLDKTKRLIAEAVSVNDQPAIEKLTKDLKILTFSSYGLLLIGAGVTIFFFIRFSEVIQ